MSGWSPNFEVRFSLIELPPAQESKFLIKMQHFQEVAPEGVMQGAPIVCEGVIDYLNDITPPPSSLHATTVLSLQGWLALSTQEGTVPEAVYVTLTDPQGKVLYLKADKIPRPDVKAHFKHPTMPDVGYRVFAKISDLSGDYILGLSQLNNGELKTCKHFNIPINITRSSLQTTGMF
jgi:hypothetical protein